jgi:hypothetical protein
MQQQVPEGNDSKKSKNKSKSSCKNRNLLAFVVPTIPKSGEG